MSEYGAMEQFFHWCEARERATGKWPTHAKLSDCQIIAIARELLPLLDKPLDVLPEEMPDMMRRGKGAGMGLYRVQIFPRDLLPDGDSHVRDHRPE